VTSHGTSLDGTRVAFDRLGEGPLVIVVGGILSDRQTTRPLAEKLAEHVGVTNYDRRGRGDSGDTAPYAVEREIEDLGALIATAGGTAAVYGHSSGACLALRAAADGLPIAKLVLHEPPYGPGDEKSRQEAREGADKVLALLAEDRRGDAIKLFLTAAGLPPEMAEEASKDPKLLALATTMPYDYEVVGDSSRGGAVPEELVRALTMPTLVISGSASPAFFQDTAARVAELLPNGEHIVLEGQDHDASADAVAPVVAEFIT
jgi:pimeloyl-ACP methyl ester carboxylesterase